MKLTYCHYKESYYDLIYHSGDLIKHIPIDPDEMSEYYSVMFIGKRKNGLRETIWIDIGILDDIVRMNILEFGNKITKWSH